MKKNISYESGWLNINKKVGLSSAKIVGKIKKKFSLKKIGHLGTLDPQAEGVLPLAIGEATKTIKFISNKVKTYKFIVKWGEETETFDHEGAVTRNSPYIPKEKEIKEAINKYFIGNIFQKPPKFSAVKINGERAYNLARRKIKFETQEKKIVIYHFKLLNTLNESHSEFEVKCGPGTYVRTLANDLAIKIGTFAHTSKIARIEDCFFNIDKALDLEMLMSIGNNKLNKILYPVDYAVKNFRELYLEGKYLDSIKNGKITFVDFLEKPFINDKETVLIKNKGKLVSIANLEKGYIIPQRNFNN